MFDLWDLQKVLGLPSLQMNEAYSAIDTKIKGKYNCTKFKKKMKSLKTRLELLIVWCIIIIK